mmetsp:Transcript_22061/g.71005  ORF Transcript_22061/g.71005 Transcript_22061/m.71005 type:complete len:310 (+) Transcript_22061:2083-3012(+)
MWTAAGGSCRNCRGITVCRVVCALWGWKTGHVFAHTCMHEPTWRCRLMRTTSLKRLIAPPVSQHRLPRLTGQLVDLHIVIVRVTIHHRAGHLDEDAARLRPERVAHAPRHPEVVTRRQQLLVAVVEVHLELAADNVEGLVLDFVEVERVHLACQLHDDLHGILAVEQGHQGAPVLLERVQPAMVAQLHVEVVAHWDAALLQHDAHPPRVLVDERPSLHLVAVHPVRCACQDGTILGHIGLEHSSLVETPARQLAFGADREREVRVFPCQHRTPRQRFAGEHSSLKFQDLPRFLAAVHVVPTATAQGSTG